MNQKLLPSLILLVGLHAASSQAASPHVHGTAKMQVAIESNSMEVELIFPLESLVGFERAPRSDKERKAVQAVMAQLNDPKALLIPAAAADCTPGKTEVSAPALDAKKRHTHGSSGHDDEHAELEAIISYQCASPAALRSMEVRLFEAFPRLQRLQVEVAAPGRQTAATLSRDRRTLSW